MNHYTLVRHGQSTANTEKIIAGKSDVPLTELGVLQAKQVAEQLKNKQFDICFCSPRLRTKQTADEILKFHNIPIVYENGISERNYGEFELLPYTEMDAHENGKLFWQDGVNPTYESAETLQQFLNKMEQFFKQTSSQFENKNILLVGHGGTYKGIRYLLHGFPETKNLMAYAYLNTEVYEFDM